MSSKEVADLVLRVLDGTEEFHLAAGVVRDGGGAVTNHGNSRRGTIEAVADFVLAQVPAVTVTRLLTIQVIGQVPAAAEILALYPVAEALTIPANFAGSKPSVIVNPAADFTITLARQVNGAGAFTTIGTIVFHTDGTVTLTTTAGAAIDLAIGDVLKATADADGDASFIGAVTVAAVVE